MREIIRVELPLSSTSVASNRIRSGRSIVRTKSGNVVAPTVSSQQPTLSVVAGASIASSVSQMLSEPSFDSFTGDPCFSPQFTMTPLSSIETVLMGSCDSSSSFEQQMSTSCSAVDSTISAPSVSTCALGLRLDIPNQINEVSDIEEGNEALKSHDVDPATSYDSDDSLKDLNWLGGLNPSKITRHGVAANGGGGVMTGAAMNVRKTLASPRRTQQNPALSVTSPRQRLSPAPGAAIVMPYIKRIHNAANMATVASPPPITSAAGTALSPIRQSSPPQSDAILLLQSPGRASSPYLPTPAPSTAASLITTSAPVSSIINHPPWVTQQREARRLNRLKRPPFSYVALCCMALASSETLTLPLSQLYKWIEDSFPYYARPECYQDWRSSIRHTLSLYTFFQSAPVFVGRKTIPTWRLDVTEPERREIARLVVEYQKHLNSQFISEWTSRLVYAEQRSHRRGAYDRQASRFKAFSALRSRSSSTDTLTSTHSTSTSATAQSGYQSFTPDSGMSSITSASGPTHLTISEADISLLSGALTSITAATVAANNNPVQYHGSSALGTATRRLSPGPVMFCGNPPSCTSMSSLASSPAPSSSSLAAACNSGSPACFETGPGITIIRIPPNAGKFGLLVLAPPTVQNIQQMPPSTPMSIISSSDHSSSAPLFDLTNQSVTLQIQQQQQQQQQHHNGGGSGQSVILSAPPSVFSSSPSSVSYQCDSPANNNNNNNNMQSAQWKQDQQHMQFMAEYHSQLVAQRTASYVQPSPISVDHNDGTMQMNEITAINNCSQQDVAPPSAMASCSGDGLDDGLGMPANGADVDFGGSMDLDLSLQDFGSAEELFSESIDFAAILDGALDTPRSLLLPPSDGM